MFEKANKIIEEYGRRKANEVKADGRGMGITHRRNSPSPDDSLHGIKVSFSRRAFDMISAIRFSLRRTLFYAYHGAGKGHGGRKGSVWNTSNGDRRRTDPKSLGKAGSGTRQAKPFLDTISRDADQLMDKVAEATMDEIFDQSFKIFK